MRKDITISDRKLTEEEFAKKYWKNGEFPYQYNTLRVMDGRNELEQVLINNQIALWELHRNICRMVGQNGRTGLKRKETKRANLMIFLIALLVAEKLYELRKKLGEK